MVEGQKDFLNLVLLFRLLYFLPEGRRVNGPCWGCVGSLDAGRGLDCRAAGPHSDAAGQDGLNNAAVEDAVEHLVTCCTSCVLLWDPGEALADVDPLP